MKTLLSSLLAFVFVLTLATASAEEKNGVSLTVSKTTLEKNDTRGAGYYSDRIDRTQGLKAVVKNTSIKEKPEGEIVWTILVKKYYRTTVELYTGTEKLKALKPFEAMELVMGKAEIGGYLNYGAADKDKSEWQVIVKHDGKETVKAQSTSSFDGMAKRAVKPMKPTREE